MPSAARQSHTDLRLCPLSRAVRISGQRARIWAALVAGFFSRRAARRVRAFCGVRLLDIALTTLYDNVRHFSTTLDRFDSLRGFLDNAHCRWAAKKDRGATQRW